MISVYCIAFLLQICHLAIAAPPPPVPSLSLLDPAKANLTAPINLTVPGAPNDLPPGPVTYEDKWTYVQVKFYDYGQVIPFSDAYPCIQQAYWEDISMIASWNSSIGSPKAWSHGSVTLSLYPDSDMLWGEWSPGIRGLEWFLQEYSAVSFMYTVTVDGKGDVGTGSLGLTPTNSNNTLKKDSSTPSNALPPDPYTYSLSNVRITFKNYHKPISTIDARNCADKAMYDAYEESKDPSTTITKVEYYKSGSVYLMVVPDEGMLWQDWERAAEAVEWFVATFGAVALQFDIYARGWRVGSGILKSLG